MNDMEMVKELVKLQVLCVRWVERNTSLKCKTHRDMERVITDNKLTCTYGEAIKNLKDKILKYCNANPYLIKEVLKLEDIIKESNIKNLRFGVEPQKKFTEEEKELDNYKLKRTFFMINEMVGIKDVAEMLGLTETAIKQACQQERLLNTRKVGKTWLVHIPECRNYWNIKDDNEDYLYYNYIY